MKNRYTKKQREWCDNYQNETTFEPLMDDFEAGNETFQKAAWRSVRWFEDWKTDAFMRCDKDFMSHDTEA